MRAGYQALTIPSDAGALAAYVQPGTAPVVVLQHGLCGDANQPAEVFPDTPDFRHAVLECRGHGRSPPGDPKDFTFARFCDDLTALIARTGRPAAVGGISMGAAMALRLAVKRPDLVAALILSRPAWVTGPAPANMQPNAEVGLLMAQGRGVADFDASPTARHLAKVAPDNLASLRSFFDRAPLATTSALLTRIAADGPGVTSAEVSAIAIPTLILATTEDFIHPLAHAQTLARLIPGAQLVKVPPKFRDRAGHVAVVQAAILQFLKGLD